MTRQCTQQAVSRSGNGQRLCASGTRLNGKPGMTAPARSGSWRPIPPTSSWRSSRPTCLACGTMRGRSRVDSVFTASRPPAVQELYATVSRPRSTGHQPPHRADDLMFHELRRRNDGVHYSAPDAWQVYHVHFRRRSFATTQPVVPPSFGPQLAHARHAGGTFGGISGVCR